MSENVHTIKIFAWARMDHYSVPEHVYMWEWNDPGGRIKVHPGCSADKILNNATGKCECPERQVLVDGVCKAPRPCPEGQTLNPTTGICECPLGQKVVDGICQECAPGDTRPCQINGVDGIQTCISA